MGANEEGLNYQGINSWEQKLKICVDVAWEYVKKWQHVRYNMLTFYTQVAKLFWSSLVIVLTGELFFCERVIWLFVAVDYMVCVISGGWRLLRRVGRTKLHEHTEAAAQSGGGARVQDHGASPRTHVCGHLLYPTIRWYSVLQVLKTPWKYMNLKAAYLRPCKSLKI